MAAYAKEKVFYISIGFWLILGVECFSGGSNHIVTIKTGGSVTIPCYYDEKNPPQNKSWHSYIDLSNKYTNTTEKNVSVIDHPDESLFTVTMRNLQSSNDGDYSCVVKTEGKPPDTFDLHLKVQSAPDVSVKNSSVSGHEGDNVSVQCFYTSGYQNKTKQWCRYKEQRCVTVGRTDTSQNSSVQISDDGRSSFTVLMTGLRLSDSGWYYCSAGEALNPVHLTVTEAETVNWTNPRDTSETGNKTNDKAEGINEQKKNKDLLTAGLLVSAALLLLLILVGVFTWRWRRRPKQDKPQSRERNDIRTIDSISEEDPVIYSTINDECPRDTNTDVTYSITDAPVSEAKPPAGGTIYSTVAPH